MNIDDIIKRFKSYHPITEEDKEAFECAINCMEFTKDFLPLNATPDRIKQALCLLDTLESMLNDEETGRKLYFMVKENLLSMDDKD